MDAELIKNRDSHAPTEKPHKDSQSESNCFLPAEVSQTPPDKFSSLCQFMMQ
jgi:hypothetical protein